MMFELFFTAGLMAFWQTAHQHNHPPKSAEEYAHHLEDPSRDEWQKPHEVIQALSLKPGEMIADIGAGSGYFSRRFAKHAGKVYAVDIDPELLERVGKDALKNLETALAVPDDPKLPENSVDTIFFCNVLHHVDNRAAYYKKLEAALKPGGRIVMIDFHKRELPVGPPLAMKLSDQELVKEMEAAGFIKVKSFDFLPYQYFLVFKAR